MIIELLLALIFGYMTSLVYDFLMGDSVSTKQTEEKIFNALQQCFKKAVVCEQCGMMNIQANVPCWHCASTIKQTSGGIGCDIGLSLSSSSSASSLGSTDTKKT